MPKKTLSQSHLKECLDYDPDLGTFIWKERPISHFSTDAIWRSWNNKYAHKKSGTITFYGYASIIIDCRHYMAHRLAWLYIYGEWACGQMDHINHNRLDNRICNLRPCTSRENRKNSTLRVDNKTGLPGVSWMPDRKRWQAYINSSEGRLPLGRFRDYFEAICARKSAELIHNFHPNHGRCNV